MCTWDHVPLTECLDDHPVGRANQINSSDIAPSGVYPVIDQGQEFIAGYTDDANRVVREGLPYVVFGDHTRSVKFVDFPFVLGADGTKVLKPNATLFDPKFFYFAVLSLDIPSRGYNRHFTLLKEKQVPQPQLDEQRKIATVLSAVQRAIERQERLINLTVELKKALMHKLFTEGTRGEQLKQSEIGLVPKSWQLTTVQQLVDDGIVDKPLDGNHGNIHPKQADYADAGIPFVMASNLVDGSIDFKNCKFIKKSLADRLQKGFSREGDVLISHKATIGVTAIVPPVEHYVMLTPQVTYYRILDATRLDSGYLRCYFDSDHFQQRFRMVADDGSTRAYIGITKQRQLPVIVPTIDEQRDIARVVFSIERKTAVGKRHRLALIDAFRTLLHQLMTAQIRVDDLDLSALDELSAIELPAGAA